MESGEEKQTEPVDSVVDPRPVHYLPEGVYSRVTRSICAASIEAANFGTWTADARNVTCYVCARMLMERMARIVVDVEEAAAKPVEKIGVDAVNGTGFGYVHNSASDSIR